MKGRYLVKKQRFVYSIDINPKVLFTLPLIFALHGCCKKKACQSDNIPARLWVFGFDSSDLARVILKSFDRGSNFTIPRNTYEILLSDYKDRPYGDPLNWDSTHTRIVWPADQSLSYNYEYIVELPNAGRVFKIKDFTRTDGQSKYCGSRASDYCYEVITSYNLNGIIYNTYETKPNYGYYKAAYITIRK